jgi:molecular chaperone GrpE
MSNTPVAAPGSAIDSDAPLAPSGDADTRAARVVAASTEAALLVAALQGQLAEQQDKYLRLAAEYDNFRKRSVRERQRAEHEGMGMLIRGLLDALDDLGRFAHVNPDTTDARTVQEGAEMVERKLLKHLAGHGLEVVNPVGQPFDPALHEAVMTAPAESADEDHFIAQVFQVGYVFNGQLLRAAKVVVKQWNG